MGTSPVSGKRLGWGQGNARVLPVAETPGPLPHAAGAEPSETPGSQETRGSQMHAATGDEPYGKVHRAHWRMRPRLGHSRSRVTAGFALGDSDGTLVDSGRPVATGSCLVRTCATVVHGGVDTARRT